MMDLSSRRFGRFLAAWALLFVFPLPLASCQDRLSFAKDVRPILSDRCFFCHGPDAETREADLRLDEREAALEYAIVAHDPTASEVVRRIESEDPDEVMPPPESKIELTAEQKEILKRWIAEGAEYEEHWAFQSVQKPTVEDAAKAIDQLVERKLESLGLSQAPEADKATLLRRLSFDITGLPPTIEELERFMADEKPGAYERQVDRLLASPRFGERMAVDWLDVARYADTYGYQNDRYRDMWPWRDWVVRAFNENLPYDEFVRDQIAGDLLPDATQNQVLATAFNRNHRQTNEGGSVEEEFRAEYVADRVNTFGAAFLGLTLECSRCHDHKYDPISQREYYQLAAYFNSIDESGLYSHFTSAVPTPTLQLSSDQEQQELVELRQRLEVLEESVRELAVDQASFAAWRAQLNDVRPASDFELQQAADKVEPQRLAGLLEKSLQASLVGDYPLDDLAENKPFNRVTGKREGRASDSPKIVKEGETKAVQLSGDNGVGVPAGAHFFRYDPFSISIWLKPDEAYERAVVFHRSRAWTDSGSQGYELLIEQGKLSAALIHFWPGNALRVVAKSPLPVRTWSKVDFVYDGSSSAEGLRLYVDGEEIETEVIRDKLTKSIRGPDGSRGGDATELAIGQRFRDNGFKHGMVRNLRVFDKRLTDLEVKFSYVKDWSPSNASEVLYNSSAEELAQYFLHQSADYDAKLAELIEARKLASARSDRLSEIMVMRELPEARETYILIRGAYDAPSERVERGTPARIAPKSILKEGDSTRLDLAEWLIAREHPLTSRVAVNRIWQSFFGQGLVTTAEDFGLQGALPVHSELLDWLAADFMDHGWNVKRLIKQIVMSGTYRQQSNPTPEALELDPDNNLLARGPASRLPAEMIRDAALYSGGLLVEKMGGPPVRPYQPAGLWKEKSGSAYQRQAGEGSHRRSLYTYWKRTSPPPSMMTLDASNREVCVVRRQVTMTPMQMLVLLNDPQYVEAARGLAEQALADSDEPESQLSHLFHSLTSRPPSKQELAVLLAMHSEQASYFQAHPSAAAELLSVGDHKPTLEVDPSALAAMTVVAEGLMSYDETVMKR